MKLIDAAKLGVVELPEERSKEPYARELTFYEQLDVIYDKAVRDCGNLEIDVSKMVDEDKVALLLSTAMNKAMGVWADNEVVKELAQAIATNINELLKDSK